MQFEPVTTLAELQSLDDREVVEGYWDGVNNEPEPRGNRSKSYWHGWHNGRADRTGKINGAQKELARVVIADQRRA
jgi:hypothetical protein